MQEWQEEAVRLSNIMNSGEVTRELQKTYEGLNYEKVRKFIYHYNLSHNKVRQGKSIETFKEDNTRVYEQEQEIIGNQEITPELIMKAKGLNPYEWKVLSFTKNVWQQQTNTGNKIDLCQSKLTVKPLIDGVDFKAISDFFINNPVTPLKPIHYQYTGTNETLVVDITDLHSGLLAWAKEVGENYDIKIMQDRMENCIDDIASRIQKGRFKKIIIATLGDIFHADNNNGTTTKGTAQQIEGRIQKTIEQTLSVFTHMINRFLEFAPVEYIYLSGNHDELLGYTFALALSQAFKNYDNITFDIDVNPFKARLIGITLLGFTHGTGKKAQTGDWLVNDFRELFGKCKVAEVHQGHSHSQVVVEQTTGVIVKTMPKMCNSSAWEHLMGYRSYAAMMCFVYDDKKSLRETWINYC